MADTDIERNVTDRLATPGSAVRTLNGANYSDVASMRTALAASTAHGTGYYTSRRLDGMTRNDMVYALRQIQNPASIR